MSSKFEMKRPPSRMAYTIGQKTGNLMIISYLGHKIPDFTPSLSSRKFHCYEVECQLCGSIFPLTQPSLNAREREEIKKCRFCSQQSRSKA